jgi:chromosome partitioning protein
LKIQHLNSSAEGVDSRANFPKAGLVEGWMFEHPAIWHFKHSHVQTPNISDFQTAMIITVASLKGGQAKTTTAVHVAALMQGSGKTLLVDGDPNRSALNWHKRKGFPFEVCDERQAVKHSRDFTHIIFDTQARPSGEDLEVLAGGCDRLIIPLTPDALSLDTLFAFTDSLKQLGATQFKVLLTIVPPRPASDGIFVRQTLEKAGLPVFQTDIRRYKAYQKAALAGVLVRDVDDDYAAAAWNDYAAVVAELQKGENQG